MIVEPVGCVAAPDGDNGSAREERAMQSRHRELRNLAEEARTHGALAAAVNLERAADMLLQSEGRGESEPRNSDSAEDASGG
ncbi:hypothetical protein [Prosthecomicrobium pneumaticum]|uniref:Uncharacterized protein n=1 Tax=Prosthecomicrobium pneumaticum TaxID=81895 RepID=A0A7W9CTP3_9HYPH|nr:hypothetical protein [Prosthecomicrobium pneumaticum]MBB5751341.1 hypothetical protein [Prosthecomicrobium pneumaticum]